MTVIAAFLPKSFHRSPSNCWKCQRNWFKTRWTSNWQKAPSSLRRLPELPVYSLAASTVPNG